MKYRVEEVTDFSSIVHGMYNPFSTTQYPVI